MPPNDRSRPSQGGSSDQIADDDDGTAMISPATPDRSPLREALGDAIAAADGAKLSLKDLTVLATQNDPFRLDTPAGHRDGAWLAMTARELGLGDRRIHLRGLHYMVIGRPKPDGKPLLDSREPFAEQCRRLVDSKVYRRGS
jgi:hypothetical protein